MPQRRRKRSQDQLTPALMPLLRGSEPGDGLDGILACTLEVDEPRAPISDQWTTMPVSGPLKVPATMTPN